MKITLFQIAAVLLVSASSARAESWNGRRNSAVLPTSSTDLSSELFERRVDQAALDSQTHAIRQLQELLKKYAGKEQESQLLIKLGEAQRRAGSMQFRIAHATPAQGGSAAGVALHRTFLLQATKSFSSFIHRFPGSPELPHAYFLRARSHSEAGNIDAAQADYLRVVQHYSGVSVANISDDLISSYMALAEIAMDKGQWAVATKHLRAVERHPDHTYYPHALYRQAWAHYNLREVPLALSYLERNIRYYLEHSPSASLSASDEALRENAAHDAALFFLEGYEQRLPHYEVSDAFAYFHRLDSGALLRKMNIRYAKHLRAHGHTEALLQWKQLALRENPRGADSFEIVVIAYEDLLNKRKYSALSETGQDLASFRGTPEFALRAEKLLLDTADQLQKLITRNKQAEGVTTLTTALTGVYDAFTRLVDERDARIPKVHFNLAESLFEIGHFEQATDHYRWVVEHGDWKKSSTIRSASLGSLGSRYEHLRKRGLVPRDLKPRSLANANAGGSLDLELAQWLDWIDAHVRNSRQMTVDNFYFEANRSLYANGHMTLALERLHAFALRYPESKYAAPSATLVVDTYVASADWQRLHTVASAFLAVPEWKGTDFNQRLYTLAADADFKTVEATYRHGDFATTLKKAEAFLATYPQSPRKADCMALAGHAALANKDTSKALQYFSDLKRIAPGTEAAASALLAEASVREDHFEFAQAAAGYRQYLALPSSIARINEQQRTVLRKKVLAFSWITEDPQASLDDKNICTPEMKEECQRFGVLGLFKRGTRDAAFTAKAFSHARHDGAAALRALWAALALEGARHLTFRDRHVSIRILTRNWKELDSLAGTFLLESATRSVPQAIALNRRDLRSVAPLLARENYLIRRVEVIREMENSVMDAAKLPWSRIRASVTNELADVYADNARDIAALDGGTAEMAAPFLKKAAVLRAQAFELASSSAIEAEAFEPIAQLYLHEDPRRLAEFLPKEPLPKPQPLDPAQLAALDPDGAWGSVDEHCQNPVGCLKTEWYRAARQKRWTESAYLIQFANERKLLSPGTLALLRALTLAGLGAQAEALHELSSARAEFNAKTRHNVNRLLLSHFQSSLARERTQQLREEMRQSGDSIATRNKQETGG